MALDSRYLEQQIFVEVFEKETPGVTGVSRREDVTTWTDAQRAEYARGFADRVDPSTYGVRIARYTVEVMETFA